MLLAGEAYKHLIEIAKTREAGMSAYWSAELDNIRILPDGRAEGFAAIGNISLKRGTFHRFMHWLFQFPFRLMGRRFSAFESVMDDLAVVAERQGRAITQDMIRQAMALSVMESLGQAPEPGGFAAVIGDGYGVMSSLMARRWPQTQVINVNLAVALFCDLSYASKTLGAKKAALAETPADLEVARADDGIGLVGLHADNWAFLKQVRLDRVVNIHSMQEMSMPIIRNYFDALRNNQAKRTLFYCNNRIKKALYDGEVIRFKNFPWQDDDEILLDEICQWDKIEYGPKPPFWRKNRNLKQHRLVWMAKGDETGSDENGPNGAET